MESIVEKVKDSPYLKRVTKNGPLGKWSKRIDVGNRQLTSYDNEHRERKRNFRDAAVLTALFSKFEGEGTPYFSLEEESVRQYLSTLPRPWDMAEQPR